MELDPRRLLVLHTVAQCGGIAAAARRLAVTPSAVSQALARLEREAGRPLLDRSGGRPVLTAAGRLLAGRGARIADELTAAARELAEADGRVAGTVTIGAAPSVLTALAVRALAFLAAEHPQLTALLHEVGHRAGLRALAGGQVDLVVVTADRQEAPSAPAGTTAQVLMEDEYRLVVPAGWDPVPATAAELAGRPWIGAPPDSARAVAARRFRAAHGLEPAGEHLAVTPGAVRAMLAARLGAVVLPASSAAQLTGPTVTAIEVAGVFQTRVYHRTAPSGPPPVVEAALRALRRAVLAVAEELAARGVLERDPVVRPRLGE
ncbi:LysR family transcriptional regulator [Kitasatospora nipponensis]|uniref:LysR family transcriptional regulator n=1 Tax=Kitasatospora nipponensis TaxID=258049 RepID=A0ABP4HCS7_9ACTN